MGRLIRKLKLGFFIVSLGMSVFMFSAFSHSPHVAMSFGEHFKQQLIKNQNLLPQSLQKQLVTFLNSPKPSDEMAVASENPRPNEVIEVQMKPHLDSPKEEQQETPKEDRPIGLVSYGGRDWVMIQGKYYVYNPKNIYVVEGVTTFFKPDLYEPEGIEAAKSKSPQDVPALGPQLAKAEAPFAKPPAIEAAKKVLHSYSPEGMQELQQKLKSIQEGMKARNETLRALQEEK